MNWKRYRYAEHSECGRYFITYANNNTLFAAYRKPAQHLGNFTDAASAKQACVTHSEESEQ